MNALLRPGAGALLAIGIVLGMVACGDGARPAPAATPGASERTVVLASSDLAIGKQRLTFVVLDGSVPVTGKTTYVRFFKNADTKNALLVGGAPIPWVPIEAEEAPHADPNETTLTGIYYVNVEFDEAGVWGLGVTVGEQLDLPREVRIQFTVKQKTDAPAIGDKAIAVANPTIKEKPLKQIHTGSDADPEFHTMTVAEALASGKPTVVAFATPSFCRTRTCGPSLQVAIRAQAKFGAKVNFVHIEPYELDANGNLVTGDNGPSFKLVKEATAWRLPTEPWVFVVDKTGTVLARFDGPYTLEELDYSLGQLTGAGG